MVSDDIALQILAELRAIRRAVERHPAPELVDALREFFGDGVFTVSGIMEVIVDDPHHQLAEAVGQAVDLGNVAGRSTRLGQVLAGLRDLELIGSVRGAAAYRLRP